MSPTFNRLATLCIAFNVGLYLPTTSAESTAQFTADESSSLSTLSIVKRLENRHYLEEKIDDELSEKIFDRFLNVVDRAKVFFTVEDIASFEKHKLALDDELKKGRVDTGLSIYNRYHKAALLRHKQRISSLQEDIASLTFTNNEYLETDIEKIGWAKNATELDERWRKRLKNDVLNLRKDKKSNDEIYADLKKRYKFQLKRLEQINNDDVYEFYMNAVAYSFDPHTSWLSPRQEENFHINMSRKLEGIGAVLKQDFEFTEVVRLVHGGPAHKQGDLHAADKIVAIGQGKDGDLTDVTGWRLDEVVNLIRGPAKTWVKLEVIPSKAKVSGAKEIVYIQRGTVELKDQLVKSDVIEVLEGEQIRKIGVINVPDFYADFAAMSRGDKNFRSTTRDVAKELQKLSTQNIDGIVIDLRGNGGGALVEANNMACLFINRGPIVQIRNASNRVQEQGRCRGAYYNGPLTVVINRLSASASEIFAGAMQDHGRALVVGTTSFGKGTVQNLMPVHKGELKITSSKYYRVSGQSTQHRGIVPDVLFPNTYDPELVGESALDGALAWDKIGASKHQKQYDFSPILNDLQKHHLQRTQADPDFVFLREEFELIQSARKDSLLSLNEAQRDNDVKEAEDKFLAIENKRRVAKGLEAWEEIPDSDAEEPIDPSAELDASEDIILLEAAKILVDSVRHLSKPQMAKQNY